jgi:hypothetical protein
VGLFFASFCITLFTQTSRLRQADSAYKFAMPTLPVAPARTEIRDMPSAGREQPADRSAPDDSMPVAPAATPQSENFAALIETAMTDDDSQARGVAIRELSQVPAEESISVLEQVLRTDDEPENRALAMQMVLQIPVSGAAGASRQRLVQEFAGDTDGRVAALAREGY